GGQDVTSTLESVAGVTKVQVIGRQNGVAAIEIESVHGRDVRRELARAVVNQGWGLLELRPVKMSLEEIFLHLTTEETPELSEAEVPRG
ncbi:MAG: hypothetical protein HY654_11490, partial [Acidobacteria bacterium]|nr:hypothetical protein [Acidobacteriota bacterium]